MKPERTGIRQNWNIEASRTIAGALTREPWRCHVASGARKSAENFRKSANYSQIGAARSHLKLCWRPLAAAEAGAAASGAAGMPVRWRRRPAAASAAVAAGADPDFSCAGELEPADRPAIRGKCALGWVCRPPLWVWWSSLVGGSISLIGLCLLGSSLRAGALDFIVTRNRTFCFSGPLRVCLSSRYLRPVL